MSSTKEITLDWQAIGTRIRKERERLGLTQEDIAAQVGFKRKSSVSHIENGGGLPLSIACQIAALFEKDLDWLVTGQQSGEVTFRVAESAEEYDSSKKRQLINAVKRFAVEADDSYIEALLRNLNVLRDLMEKQKM